TLLLLFVVACHRDHRPHATGSFAFDTAAIKGDPDLFFATEAEIVRSARILERANQRLAPPQKGAAQPPVRVEVERRGATALFDVTVYADDREIAQRTCNAVIETYVESRLVAKQAELTAKIEALDAAGSNAQRDALVLEQHTHENDVRLLDPCVVR
ncbi:MAG TPA: hypothetical protein VF403_01585, partial [Kofleriaceae bacterium]